MIIYECYLALSQTVLVYLLSLLVRMIGSDVESNQYKCSEIKPVTKESQRSHKLSNKLLSYCNRLLLLEETVDV